jgi:hypothetical protein
MTMSKWFENTLLVSGEEPELRWFEQSAKPVQDAFGSKLSLERLYPMPVAVYPKAINPAELKARCDDRWYHWCLTHWGTIDIQEMNRKFENPNSGCGWEFQLHFPEANLNVYRLDVVATITYGEPESLVYRFVSAEGAPVGWLVKVGGDFALRFKLTYEAPELGVRGVTVVDQGAILVDECQRYA